MHSNNYYIGFRASTPYYYKSSSSSSITTQQSTRQPLIITILQNHITHIHSPKHHDHKNPTASWIVFIILLIISLIVLILITRICVRYISETRINDTINRYKTTISQSLKLSVLKLKPETKTQS